MKCLGITVQLKSIINLNELLSKLVAKSQSQSADSGPSELTDFTENHVYDGHVFIFLLLLINLSGPVGEYQT